jgi:hypothetical protein
VPLLIVSLLSSTAIGYLLARIFLPVYKPAWTDLLLKFSALIAVVSIVSNMLVY